MTTDHCALIEGTKDFHTFCDYSLFLSCSFFVVGVVQLQEVVNLAEKCSRRVQRSLMVDLDAVRRLAIDVIPHISIGSHVVTPYIHTYEIKHIPSELLGSKVLQYLGAINLFSWRATIENETFLLRYARSARFGTY